jgi:hypothetical protein
VNEMIVLLFALAFIALAIGIIIYIKVDSDVGFMINTIATVCLIIFIIPAIGIGACISDKACADEKIALYQSENNRIEREISMIVENYKDYEKDTFAEFKRKDATTLVTMFPELKSDKLVCKQIDIYNKNKQKIVALKEDKISIKPLKWWLYFGS